jgi:hypothetical protein
MVNRVRQVNQEVLVRKEQLDQLVRLDFPEIPVRLDSKALLVSQVLRALRAQLVSLER